MTISLQALNDGSAKLLVNGAERLIIEADGTLRGVANPPQFDADSSLATSAFVQRALGNYAASETYTAGVNLSAADAGKFINLAGSGGQTAQLPSLTSVPDGATFTFQSTSVGNWTISRNGADNITVSGGLFPNFSLFPGECVQLTKETVSGTSYWYLSGQSVQNLKNTPSLFGSSFLGNGWQKLPSGLIIQWGMTTSSGEHTSWTFPISFPAAPLGVFCNMQTDNGSAVVTAFNNSTAFGSSLVGGTNSTGSNNYNWLALGY